MTVTEIANLAGVSIGTVDRVIHNRGRVSENTRKKVQRIIDEKGYQPNALARHLKKNCIYRIGVLIPEISSESGYWEQIYYGIKSTAEEELGAFSFKIESFEFKRHVRESLVGQFERMLASDCCAYVIAPVIQDETLVLLSDYRVTVPYCFIDSTLPGAVPLTTVTQDPFRAGFLAGRLTELLAGRTGTYAVFKLYMEAYNQNERVKGFRTWFEKENNGNLVVEEMTRDSSKENFAKGIDKLLSEHPDVAGICVVNAATHIAAELIEERGLKKQITITGFDLLPENRKMLLNGSIDCLISQKPVEQGRDVMLQLYKKLVMEDSCTKDIMIPLDIFFKENID